MTLRNSRILIFAIALALLGPSSISGQNWTLEDIDDWIERLESAASLALLTGDGVCHELLLAAGAGYGKVNSVSWNDNLRRTHRANGIYNPITKSIEIDRNSDDVTRTIIHEGLHASRKYTASDVHSRQSQIQFCATEYFRI